MIDRELPGRPQFERTEVIIGDETLEFYSRDVLSCIRGLFGDPSFMHDLVFCPEQVYTNPEQTEHIYNEIHTGDWWWAVQVCNTDFG
jgi:Plavaka transposase